MSSYTVQFWEKSLLSQVYTLQFRLFHMQLRVNVMQFWKKAKIAVKTSELWDK